MQLHTFNICSLMCLSFSNISNGPQWKVPHSLQINKRTYIATGTSTISYFINHCHSRPHTGLSVFKNVTTVVSNNTTEFYFPWSCSSDSELGTHTSQQVEHETHTSIKSIKFVYCYIPARRTYKYLDKLHLHSMFLHNSLLKHCHKFVLCQLQVLNNG